MRNQQKTTAKRIGYLFADSLVIMNSKGRREEGSESQNHEISKSPHKPQYGKTAGVTNFNDASGGTCNKIRKSVEFKLKLCIDRDTVRINTVESVLPIPPQEGCTIKETIICTGTDQQSSSLLYI